MIEKLLQIDSVSLLAGILGPAVQENRDKINELVETVNRLEELNRPSKADINQH